MVHVLGVLLLGEIIGYRSASGFAVEAASLDIVTYLIYRIKGGLNEADRYWYVCRLRKLVG